MRSIFSPFKSPGRLPAALAILLLFGGSLLTFAAGIDDAAARKLSDSFMADLIANKVGDAVNLMAPEYIHQVGHGQAEARIRKFFGYCGQPTDKELVDDKDDVLTYPDGHTIPMKTIYYSSATTTYRKGNCWFSVSVVASPVGLRVSQYGALHQFAGEI